MLRFICVDMEDSTSETRRPKSECSDFKPLEQQTRDIRSKDDFAIDRELKNFTFRVRRDAEEFYAAYARDRGFDIRMYVYLRKRCCVWVCNCHGFTKVIGSRVRQNRSKNRTGCMARLKQVRVKGTKPHNSFNITIIHDQCIGEDSKF